MCKTYMPSVWTLYAQESEGSEESELSPTHQVVEDLTKAVESKGAAVPSVPPRVSSLVTILTPKEGRHMDNKWILFMVEVSPKTIL